MCSVGAPLAIEPSCPVSVRCVQVALNPIVRCVVAILVQRGRIKARRAIQLDAFPQPGADAVACAIEVLNARPPAQTTPTPAAVR